MNTEANQPDLIITISHDKVRLDLLGQPESARHSWSTSFKVDHLFLEDRLAESIDLALIQNPYLLDYLPCVEVIVLDIPNICLPRTYHDTGKVNEIAARYLRLRAGDSLNTDFSADNLVFCYTFPTQTLEMLREYYSTISCSHFSSVLWNYLSLNHAFDSTRMYFTMMEDILTVIAVEENKLAFLKNFRVRDEADVTYFSMACSRMLRSKEHHVITIGDQHAAFRVTETKGFTVHHHTRLPSLHILLAQYKPCGS